MHHLRFLAIVRVLIHSCFWPLSAASFFLFNNFQFLKDVELTPGDADQQMIQEIA